MCWPPIEWSFVRGKSQIALVTGHVYQVVVDEEAFIQWSNGKKNGWSFIRVVVSSGVLLYITL